MTLDGVGEVSQCGVNGTHVAQLARLRQLAPGLAGQQDTLFVAGQSVGVVPYGGVHMAQAAEGARRRLQSHTYSTHNHNSHKQIQGHAGHRVERKTILDFPIWQDKVILGRK